MNDTNRLASGLLRSPLLWGALVSACFYAPLETGYFSNEYLSRYLAGHWMEYVEVSMFFVGLSALVLKFLDVQRQSGIPSTPLLKAIPEGGQAVRECDELLAELDQLPSPTQFSYQVQRLKELLRALARKGSAATLDAEMKYLADLDASRASHSYGFVRIIIWALPILGLLGTVVGITLVIANLSPQHLEESLPAVTAGLSVAFDTTAVALALSMGLMFTQYFVDRAESRLLTQVDARVSAELLGRFHDESLPRNQESDHVRRLFELVARSTESLVVQQADLWRTTMEAAHERWERITAAAGGQLEQALSMALTGGLREHAAQLTAAERALAEQNHKQSSAFVQSLDAAADAMTQQQHELAKQTELLARVVEATGEVTSLERTLNNNLRALAGAKNFEETALSLAAAVQLLSSKLQSATGEPRPVELNRTKRTGQAA